MTTTINAQATNGLITTADGSGIVKLQSDGKTTNALVWLNYNGSTPGVRSSYNVTSVTKNGTGDYTLNFTNAQTDANYSTLFTPGSGSAGSYFSVNGVLAAPTTSACRVLSGTVTSAAVDCVYACASIFGN